MKDDLPKPGTYRAALGDPELERLKAPRQAIAEALILVDDHPGPEMVSILLEILETGDADKRRDIVIQFGKLGPDAAKTTVPALIGVLADTDKDVSRPTSNWRSSNAFPLEKIKEIRLEAVKSLGRIGAAAKPALHALTLAMKTAAPEKATRVQQLEVSDKPASSADAKIRDDFLHARYRRQGDAAGLCRGIGPHSSRSQGNDWRSAFGSARPG